LRTRVAFRSGWIGKERIEAWPDSPSVVGGQAEYHGTEFLFPNRWCNQWFVEKSCEKIQIMVSIFLMKSVASSLEKGAPEWKSISR